jgi:curved DNA-binding protein CbpA
MTFFTSCKTIDEAKKLYRELCKQHHPDVGGDAAIMSQINEEYSKFTPTGNRSEDMRWSYQEAFNRFNGGFGFNFNQQNHFNDAYFRQRQESQEIKRLRDHINHVQYENRMLHDMMVSETEKLKSKIESRDKRIKEYKKQIAELKKKLDWEIKIDE